MAGEQQIAAHAIDDDPDRAATTGAGRSEAAADEDAVHGLDDTEFDGRSRALARFFESYFRLHPVQASLSGATGYDHLLPDWSPEGLSTARREMSELRRELAQSGLGVLDDATIRTRDWTAIDGALADAFLEMELAELDTPHFQRGNLFLAIEQALGGVRVLLEPGARATEPVAVALASRLRAFPLYLIGVRRTLEQASIPDAWRELSVRACASGRALLDSVEPWVERAAPGAAVRNDVAVGLSVARESLSWMSSFVRGLRAARASRYAAGSPLLELLIRRGHWLDVPVSALRREAHDRLDEEEAALALAIATAGEVDARAIAASIEAEVPSRSLTSPTALSRIGRIAALSGAGPEGPARRQVMLSGETMVQGLAVVAAERPTDIEALPRQAVASRLRRVRELVRAVVDLELHGGRMSFERAVSTFETRGRLDTAAAQSAAVATSMFPGTSVAGWLGMTGIHRMRRQRESLGTDAAVPSLEEDLSRFGAIPVALAARIAQGDASAV